MCSYYITLCNKALKYKVVGASVAESSKQEIFPATPEDILFPRDIHYTSFRRENSSKVDFTSCPDPHLVRSAPSMSSAGQSMATRAVVSIRSTGPSTRRCHRKGLVRRAQTRPLCDVSTRKPDTCERPRLSYPRPAITAPSKRVRRSF